MIRPELESPYFAQFGEDRILEEIFGAGSAGTCVEVGAFDGVTGSTTYRFEQRGWRCLLVEPDPEMAARIRGVRRSPVVCGAASAAPGTSDFTIDDSDRQRSGAPRASKRGRGERQRQRTIRVPTDTLDRMLVEHAFEPPIDFVSVDVEGAELDVLRGFSLEVWKPSILIVEDNDPAVRDHMARANYRWILRTGVNDWYLRLEKSSIVSPGLQRRLEAVARAARIEKTLYVAFRPLADALPRGTRDWIKRVIRRAFG